MRKSSLKYLLLAGVAGGLMAFTVAQEGSISGSVTPVEASAVVWTVAGFDTLKAPADATTGALEITGVPAGDYVVTIDGADPYVDTTLMVTVRDGQATAVGALPLSDADIASDSGGFF